MRFSLMIICTCAVLTALPGAAQAEAPHQLRRLPPPDQQALIAHDVQLTDDGKLNGQLVDAQGLPLPGATVALRNGDETLDSAVSNDDGYFSVSVDRGGTYQLATLGADTSIRAWRDGTAPQAATDGVLLVAVEETVRGRGPRGSLLSKPEAKALFAIPAIIGVGAVVQKDRQDDNDYPTPPPLIQPAS